MNKIKAVFQIVIILIASMYFSYSLAEVNAQGENLACCEKTLGGNYCIYTDSDQCDQTQKIAQTSCEQTSFCGLGCGIDSDSGKCYKNVPQSLVRENGDDWVAVPDCSVPECAKNCCVIGDQCSYVTEKQCNVRTSFFPELTLDYRDAFSETECIDTCRLMEEGCCISSDGLCTYAPGTTCEYTIPGNETGFFSGIYCSDPSLSCECIGQFEKKCIDEDVYWYDSCGNKESLAEDCDYSSGTICKERTIGQAQCVSVNCQTTYSDDVNIHDPNMGSFRKNGESWCVYESGTGNFLDRPGTRHYRHICINGEEIVEECKDYREEICVQGSISTGLGVYTESNCIANDNSTISTVPIGFNFWDDSSTSFESGQEECNKASVECPAIVYKKSRAGDWHTANAECFNQEFADNMSLYCKSMGDCGADYNVASQKSTDSFRISFSPDDWHTKKPTWTYFNDQLWEDWKQLGVQSGMKLLSESYELDFGNSWQKAIDEMGDISTYHYASAGVYAVATYLIVTKTAATIATFGGWIGIIIAIIILIIGAIITSGGESHERPITYTCEPWQPPTGGDNCHLCNADMKTCSEYKCKSLGTACEYLNPGTGNETCVNVHENDVSAPLIKPWPEALTQGYEINQMADGYTITPLVNPFQPISFGIQVFDPETNLPDKVQCKIDNNLTNSYDEMNNYVEDILYKDKHRINFSLLTADKEYTYYIRCQDPAGNSNTKQYQIKFTTQAGPDLTAPQITDTSILNNGYLPYGTNETAFSIYANEPANCRWDTQDQDYEDLINPMICNTAYNPRRFAYECVGALTNLTKSNNKFYFKCQDTSENKNTMQQSYEHTLIGTDKLDINFIEPSNETIYYTKNVELKLGTFGGAENGVSICSYSLNNQYDIEFFETSSTVHRQPLEGLSLGEYTVNFECVDVAGNQAKNETSFYIDVDDQAPQLVNIYQGANLVIELNENSNCEYLNQRFEFGEGTAMDGANTKIHSAPLGQNVYYIICEDIYENQMDNIIIYPSE